MKYLLILTFGLLFLNNLSAQVGLLGGYHSLKNNEWNDAIKFDFDTEFTTISGYSVGLDYWFRLKKRRIEFTPTLAYGDFSEENNNFLREHQFISFHFNTNVYIFDLAEDCNCPTWSKEGNIFKKGFFIQISPGITNMTNEHTSGFTNDMTIEEKNTYPEIGIGAGLDLGLSDFLTVTPIVKYIYSRRVDWKKIYSGSIDPIDGYPSGNNRQTFLGLRIGFRFDELNRF